MGLDDGECDETEGADAREGLQNVLSAITKVSHIQQIRNRHVKYFNLAAQNHSYSSS